VVAQGKVVVDRSADGDMLLMTPDGDARLVADAADAERIARRWFRRHADDGAVNVGEIEWRAGTKG
jgi:hypothetical protein